MRAPRPIVVLTGLLGIVPIVSAAPPTYDVHGVDGAVVHIDDMNVHGEVVGWTTTTGDVRAYVAGPAHPYELLPLPTGYASAWAKDINDLGVVVGSVGEGFTPELGMAAVWTPLAGGGWEVELLGALDGHTQSVATGINNAGDIIGYSIRPGFQGGPTVCFNGPGGITDLSALGAPASPQDINDGRVICGWNGGLFDLDEMTGEPLPGTIPADWSSPLSWAINDHDEITGYALVPTNIRFATRYTDAGGWEQLGNAVGASAQASAYDINDDGTVVLETSIPGFGWGVGAFFDDGGLVPLEELVAPDQGAWSFVPSLGGAINDAGQIAAIAIESGGSNRLVILTPRPATVGTATVPVALSGSLDPAHPNPFHAHTTIGYDVPAGGVVSLAVYDASGRLIRRLVDGALAGGREVSTWDGDDDAGRRMPSGVYFVRLKGGTVSETRSIHLIR